MITDYCMYKSNPLPLLLILNTVQAQYFFKHAEDREICQQLSFIEISSHRVVSLTQMSWQSAHACCKMKGRILHTIEKSIESDEYPLQKTLIQTLGIKAEDMQFWIGLSFHKEHFVWSFGSILPPNHKKIFQETYQWVEGNPKLSSTSRCVAISPYRGILEMRTNSCNLKLNFICQKISRIGGGPLSGFDMMMVGSTKFKEIPGFRNLKFSTVYTRWPVANAICQARNWALIDRVQERYGYKLVEIIRHPKYLFNESSKIFHSSGNNFCGTHEWKWACGEALTGGNVPWAESKNISVGGEPKMRLENHRNCLQYTLKSAGNDSPWITNMAECNEYGYTICDTTASCYVNDQYNCLFKDPHFIDIESDVNSENEVCKNSKFFEWKAPNSDKKYMVSLTKFTWVGGNNCCKFKGWIAPAPDSIEKLQSLQKVIVSFCQNGSCDGFWSSTVTDGYFPHSPLRYPNRTMLSRSLYSLIRADAFTYPSCGRINLVNFEGWRAKYMHADCLEKNFLVCEEKEEEQTHIMKVRKAMDALENANEFNESSLVRFFESPTEDEEGRRVKNHTRDTCSKVDILQDYLKHCPKSATAVENVGESLSDPSTKAKIIIPFQNKRILLDALVTAAFYEPDEPEYFKTYAFNFLNISAKLFTEFCPIVPYAFLENSLKLFHALYRSVSPIKQPEIINKVNFDWTVKLLGICEDYIKPVNIKYDSCGDLVVAEESCSNFVCTDTRFEFNLYTNDILLDIIWKVFETIHAACFPAFKQNPLLHHKYAMVIADLWGREEIRFRWTRQLATKKFWKRLLGPNFEIHVLNLERCSTATIGDSYFQVRLPRTSIPRTVRVTGFSYDQL